MSETKNKSLEDERIFENSLDVLVKSSAGVLVCVLLSKVFTYLYKLIIAREFGVESYGLFTLASMVVGWFIIFSSAGLYEGTMRYASIYRGKNDVQKVRYLRKYSLLVSATTSVLAGALLFLLADKISIILFHNSELSFYLKFFSLAIPFFVISNPLLGILRGYEKIGTHAFLDNVVQSASKLFFLFAFILIGLETDSIAYSYVFGAALFFTATYLISRRVLAEIFLSPKLSASIKIIISKEVLSYSWPLIFVGALSSIMYWIDSFFLGYFKGVVAVGLYNAAVPIALLLFIAPTIVSQLFTPLIINYYGRKDLKTVRELNKQVGKWIFIFNLPLFILLFLFPGAALNLLFGSEYLPASTSLQILSIGMIFSSVLLASAHSMNMLGKSKTYLLNIVSATLLNVVLNFFLIPLERIAFINNSSGLNGAAIATTTSMLFLYSVFLFQTYYFAKIFPIRRKMLNVLASGITSGIILNYLSLFFEINISSIIFLSFIFLVSYSILIFLTKSLDKNDLGVLKRILNKNS